MCRARVRESDVSRVLTGYDNAGETTLAATVAEDSAVTTLPVKFVVGFAPLLLLLGLQSPAHGQCVVPPAGLIAWWPGDGNANDIVGGNDGTPIDNATFATGYDGEAFSLDGTGDYVDVTRTSAVLD